MGLFSKNKETCSICGANVGFGSKPLSNGYICKQCRAKISPYLNYYTRLTADEMRDHLKYREDNFANLRKFNPTKILLAPRTEDDEIDGPRVFLDENRREFLFSVDNNYMKRNSDLFEYSDFRSFSYSVFSDNPYRVFSITVKAYSKASKSIIEENCEWTFCASEEYESNPEASPEYKDFLTEILDTERIFNSMSETSSGASSNSPVNIHCPHCGALANANGKTANCTFCGSTFINPLFESENVSTVCANCGRTLEKFDNSKKFAFCPYCGGNVYSNTGMSHVSSQLASGINSINKSSSSNEPNLYISFKTVNSSVGMVTRIVSTGVKDTYVDGQTLSFHLAQGHQTIILKIGRKNYSRDIVIPSNNSPVRIYASYNGRAQISIDQPPF